MLQVPHNGMFSMKGCGHRVKVTQERGYKFSDGRAENSEAPKPLGAMMIPP